MDRLCEDVPRSVSVVMACLFAMGCAGAATVEESARLENGRIDISIRGTFFGMVETIRRASGANIVVDVDGAPGLQVERGITLKTVEVASALKWVARLYGLECAIRPEAAVIAPTRRLLPSGPRSYDIRRLKESPDGPHARIGLAGGTEGLVITSDTPKVPVDAWREDVIDLVKCAVAPGSWEGAGIEATLDDRLLLTHAPDEEDEVSRLLKALELLAYPTVVVSAQVVDMDALSPSLVADESPVIYASEEIEAVVAGLGKAGSAHQIQVMGNAGRRLSTMLLNNEAITVDIKGADPIWGSCLQQGLVLDARPFVSRDGRFIDVELCLFVEQTSELGVAKTAQAELPLHEWALATVQIPLKIPNGGGALLRLPKAGGKVARLCLVKASTVEVPASPQSPIADPLRLIPVQSIDLTRASIDVLAEWVRGASGLNVLVDEAIRDRRVTLRLKDVAIEKILSLALEPQGLGYVLRDEALFLTSARRERELSPAAVMDVRDLPYRSSGFSLSEEAEVHGMDVDDLVNLIRHTVCTDQWDEDQGACIVPHGGALVIRNTRRVVDACRAFIEEGRWAPPRRVTVTAEIMSVPLAAVDKMRVRSSQGAAIIDEETLKELRAAGTTIELLKWPCSEGGWSVMSWDCSRSYLADFKDPAGNDPVSDVANTKSFVKVRPVTARDGRSIRMDVIYRDETMGMKHLPLANGLAIQGPAIDVIENSGQVDLAPDRYAVLHSDRRLEEKAADHCRLWVLKATVE